MFKENILDRIKAYNVIALIDFTTSTLEIFYKRKLREFYNSRDRRNHLYLKHMLKKTEYLQKENIRVLDNYLHQVPSESLSRAYLVDIRNGMCNCKHGIKGSFCKHLAVIYKFFDLKGNYFSPVIIEARTTKSE